MKFVDEQGEGTSPTRSALRVYREHRAAACRPTHPLDFAPTALQPLIRRNGVTDRRRWESALFLKVRDEIQTGNLAIDGAKNFGRFEAFFVPSAQWEQVRDAFWARTGFPVGRWRWGRCYACGRGTGWGRRWRSTGRTWRSRPVPGDGRGLRRYSCGR